MAMAALDAVATEYQTDPSRTYLTGMSMGGYGTYELACFTPSALPLVPVCGGITGDEPNR
jgi:predicted peptidase